MSYPKYKSDLQRIHESEIYGVAVFDAAARCTRDAERKKKWLRLKDLEEQTLARYLAYMRESGQPVIEPDAWRIKGYAEGAALGVMPWRLAMKMIRSATASFLESFSRLQEHAVGRDREFFAYVYAHEKAIQAFANRELAADRRSLEAVELLLAG